MRMFVAGFQSEMEKEAFVSGGVRKAMDAIRLAWMKLRTAVVDPLTRMQLGKKLEQAEKMAEKGDTSEARRMAEEALTWMEMML